MLILFLAIGLFFLTAHRFRKRFDAESALLYFTLRPVHKGSELLR